MDSIALFKCYQLNSIILFCFTMSLIWMNSLIFIIIIIIIIIIILIFKL